MKSAVSERDAAEFPKGDPLVDRVTLLETVSPHFARVAFPTGRVDTVSTHDLASLHNSTRLLETADNGNEFVTPQEADDVPGTSHGEAPTLQQCSPTKSRRRT